MQSFGAFLSDNKGWAALAALLATVILMTIVLFLYRLAFGRRLHMSGGRSRQPRLGVVDAFDLDRQRQLVLIRRDNVEHLVMIGGPNDLVIESAFIRAQPSVALPAGRDKEVSPPAASLIPMPPSLPLQSGTPPGPDVRAAAPVSVLEAPPAPPPASPPLDLTHPVSPKDLGPLADIPAPAPVETPSIDPSVAPQPMPSPPPMSEEVATPAEDAKPLPKADTPITSPGAALPPVPPTPRAPFSRLAQGLQPRPPGSVLPPRPPLASLRTPTATPGPPATPRPALPNRPTPLAPLQRGTSAVSFRRDPPPPADTGPDGTAAPANQGMATEPESEAPPALRPTLSPAVVPSPAITLDSIESLEEEMAKLLGRAAGNDKK